MFFTSRQEIRNENGDWVPSSLVKRTYSPFDPDTLTGSSVSIAAVYSAQFGIVQLDCHYNYESIDGNWADGISMTFPAGITVVSAPAFEAGGGTVTPEIINYGDSTVVNMGLVNHELTEDGIFHGEEDWVILVQSFTPPETVGWTIFDDGWSGGPVDAIGTTTVEEIGYASREALYWNVRDLDAGGAIKLENQSVVDGTALFPRRDDLPTGFGTNSGQVMDGVEVALFGSYDAPIVPFDYEITPIDPVNPSLIGTGSAASATRTVFANYTLYGLPTSWAIDGFGFGTDVVDDLQQDYELRYTGVLETTVTGTDTLITVASGGQMATIFSTVSGAGGLANHPLNPNPGTADPFLIRIPFEVWNKDTGEQVNVVFRDREQSLTGNPFWAWYPNNRNYMIIVNTAYDPNTVIGTGHPDRDEATWIVVIYSTRLAVGDIVTITYANPFQIGVDTYRFRTTASTYSDNLAADDVNKINVFPNPYYGVNPQEINKYERFVTINHLPDFATIRIFNLAGQLVRTIEKSTPGQFQRWDLTTDSGLPVASGLYIIYVDMPELGKTKILKAAVIQEQQILDRF
jgi:hypothetical protein